MSTSHIASLTWALILGGLLVLALGWTVRRNDAALGWALVAGSVVAIAAGVVLIWVRSRMPERGKK
jgi:hypothetical protein